MSVPMTDGVPLAALGWDARLQARFDALDLPDLAGPQPGRVARVDRGALTVLLDGSTVRAELSPALRRLAAAGTPEAIPAAGDWVAVRMRTDHALHEVAALLPRDGAFVRRAPVAHDRTEGAEPAQVLAANVTVAFLVAAATDVRAGRLERAGVVAWEAGALPVVVLTKADLVTDPSEAIATAEAAVPGVPIHLIDSLTGEGIAALTPYLVGTPTVVLLGASGVGKSTLANALLGAEVLATGAVREADGRGRHTTTARHLVPLPGGGALIDTPGIRAIATWGASDGIDRVFEEIEAIAAECRFSDCGHESEPGCAVRDALASGVIDPARLERFRRVERERGYQARRENPTAAAAERAKWKQIQRTMRKRGSEKHD